MHQARAGLASWRRTTLLAAALLVTAACGRGAAPSTAEGPAAPPVGPSSTGSSTTAADPAGGAGTSAITPTTVGLGQGSDPGSTGSNGRCQSAQLAVKLVDSRHADIGYTDWLFELRNTTVTTCTMAGYPTLQLLDGDRKPMATLEERGAGPLLTGRPTAPVTLPAGAAAVFGIETYTCQPPVRAQPPAPQVLVTPPDETAAILVTVTPAITTCDGGLVVTSPVRSDPSGVPS